MLPRALPFSDNLAVDDLLMATQSALYKDGGGGGIRTHGRFPYGGFQDRCHKPLDHPSIGEKIAVKYV